jgi:hypothetical protein
LDELLEFSLPYYFVALAAVLVVEQEDDPVIQGIYERLAENESLPAADTYITFGPISLLIRQEWIALKDHVLTQRPDKQLYFSEEHLAEDKRLSSTILCIAFC